MNIQRKNSAHHFRMQSEREQTLVFIGIFNNFTHTVSSPLQLAIKNPLNKSLYHYMHIGLLPQILKKGGLKLFHEKLFSNY